MVCKPLTAKNNYFYFKIFSNRVTCVSFYEIYQKEKSKKAKKKLKKSL